MKKNKNNKIEFENKDSRNNTLLWGYTIKFFIMTIWSIPWTVILGYSLNFSSLFWGMIEYYSAVLLVFSLTNKDYGFLPLTYIITGVYFIYTLPDRWITSTYLGYNKAIAWSAINLTFAIFVIFNKSLRTYKKHNKKLDRESISDNFKKDFLKKLTTCTVILSVLCILLLIPAYVLAMPRSISSDTEVVFNNNSFEKAIKAELEIDTDKNLKCSDLDPITAITITNSKNITLGKEYTYSTETWTDNIILNFSDLITFEGNDYELESPLTNIKDLRYFKMLKYINIQSDNSLVVYNLDDLRALKSLETLVIKTSTYNKTAETNLSAIKHMKQLKCLVIDGDNLSELSFLSKLKNINTLRLSNHSYIKDISVISSLKTLEYLCISGCEITSPKTLANMDKLKYLSLYKNNISDISSLKNLSNLTYLDLRNNNISDITSLNDLTQLKYVALLGNNGIKDISSLKNLSNLKYLWLEDSDNYNLSDLSTNTELEIYTGQ